MDKRFLVGPAAILVSGMLLTGCVSSKKFTALQSDYANLNGRLQLALSDLSASQARVKGLEELLAQEKANNASLRKSLAALQATLDKSISQNSQGNVNISKLVDEINASNKYIQHLVNTKTRVTRSILF
ncbi:hypothetical protein LWM68_29925 [Niabella sp. W65]|nr:hypothetical protein [Niabella sp. W65]MCH7366610.1 hypothetical protein [Niabella sp. W65]